MLLRRKRLRVAAMSLQISGFLFVTLAITEQSLAASGFSCESGLCDGGKGACKTSNGSGDDYHPDACTCKNETGMLWQCLDK